MTDLEPGTSGAGGAAGLVRRPVSGGAEAELRGRLAEDPNDIKAFSELAAIVRGLAAEHHTEDDPQRAADDAVWALAEEVARSPRAWYPLVELARLSIDEDRELALRRLATASERDAEGKGLAMGLAMLREAGHSGDALGLGVGHWRPAEHTVEAGRQLIKAAIEAGRLSEARRHLNALAGHPDQAQVEAALAELATLIAEAESIGPVATTGGIRLVDLREAGLVEDIGDPNLGAVEERQTGQPG
jgi:hypothetical protein